MVIRFEFFEDSAFALEDRLEGFFKLNKIKKNDIMKIQNAPVVYNGKIFCVVMVIYEDNEVVPQETKSILLKKNSGPRKGMKRGPYRKRQKVDISTPFPQSGVHPTISQEEADRMKPVYHKGDFNEQDNYTEVYSKLAMDKRKSEKEYYEGLNMVVVSPPKHVKDDGEP